MNKTIVHLLSLSVVAAGSFVFSFNAPAAAGDLYEADLGTGTIFKFTPSGTKSSFAQALIPQ